MPSISSSPMQPTVEGASDGALVVLDAGVAGRPLLLSGLPASADVLVLSPERDGVEQVTEALRGRTSLSSLHLVAHGSPGALQLGNARLDLGALGRYADPLRTWSQVLEGGDVLVYGCRVGEGVAGRLFLEQVHALTGANIAASEFRIGRDGAASKTPADESITNAISQWDVFQLSLDVITFEDVSPNLDFTVFEFTITKPNDGHMLGSVVAEMEELTGVEACRVHVDKGCAAASEAPRS